MDRCTHEVRAEYWRKIIQSCQQRPSGQSAKSWMNENGISEQSYYYWQRRFRQQTYAELKRNVSVSDVTETADPAFVEIPCTSLPEQNTYTSANIPAAIIRTGTLQIEISNDISASLLQQIIREVSHA